MASYETVEGDIVDDLVFRHYGYVDGALEIVYAANRHLARLPERLPSGVSIELPALPRLSQQRAVRLFD